MKRIGVVFVLVLAFCGLADSAYLAQHEVSGAPLICTIQNLDGCNTVANSPYARMFGVPIAEYGVAFYSILFVLAALELVLFDRFLRRVLQIVSLVGVLFSLYFIFIQIYFIGAFCTYCAISAGIAFLICALASFIEPFKRRREPSLPVSPATTAPRLPMPPVV